MAKGKIRRKVRKATGSDDGFIGPSPNPKTNLYIADIALRGTGMLVRKGIERGLLGNRYTPHKARQILQGRSLKDTLLGVAVARVATRSVPGAIAVGGGLLAKTLFDRRRGAAAELEGEIEMQELADEGDDPKA